VQVVRHRKYQEELPTITTVSGALYGLAASRNPVFTAARISVEMITRTPDGGTDEPRFVLDPEKTGYEGLVVTDDAGKAYPLTVTLNQGFFKKYDTRSKLVAAVDDAVFPRTYVGKETPRNQKGAKTFKQSRGTKIVSLRGPSYATIVKKIEWADEPYPGSEISQNIVQIPNLGLVFFGELLVAPTSRRLTMIRFEFGSYEGGYADGVDVSSAGSWYP